MQQPLKAGLVGCGSVAQRGVLPHLNLADAREKVQLAAVVDTVPERAQQTAERYNIPAWFTSVEEMLAGADVDLALVVTPIRYHFANALAEANELLAARDRAGIKLIEGWMQGDSASDAYFKP
jgi:predicted dehydrogenase